MIADDPKQWATGPSWLPFNMNDTVRVKLLPRGLAEYRRVREDINARLLASAKPFPVAPKLDAEGYYTTQLWCLMADFGHLVGMGFDPPFETDLLLRKTTP